MAAGSCIIVIKFQGDTSSMQKMEKDMNGRLNKVTKRFGQGLQKAGKMLKFSAYTTAAVGIVSQLLSPLQEINTALDNILAKSSNIKDQADAMNTDVGFYAALQSAAAAKGIDQAQFNMMGQRVMELIGEAKNGKENVLSKYKDETDMGRALYKIVDALHKMPAGAERTAMASDIFGGRITGRMQGLLNSGFDEPLTKVMGGVDIEKLSNAIVNLEKKSNLQSELRANLDLRDYIGKDRRISNKILYTQNQYENLQRATLNHKLKDYNNIVSNGISMEYAKEQFYKSMLPMLQVATPVIYALAKWLEGLNFAANGFGEIIGAFAKRIIYEVKLAFKPTVDRGR